MSKDEIALQITVRRIKEPPFYVFDLDKYPDNPAEFVAILNFVKLGCEKTINDFANETGFTDKLEN